MRNDLELLVHARWYFGQAAQGTDQRKMKLLAELGLEYLRLVGEDTPSTVRLPAGDLETAASRDFVKK